MKVIICTENKAKIQAVEEVLRNVWSDIQITGEKFSSDVSEQPMTEKAGVEGAINRSKNAKSKYQDFDYYIGMEGYVDTSDYGMFLAGAVAIIDKSGNIGIGLSAKMQLPAFIKNKIDAGKELGPLIKALMNDTDGDIRQYEGANGILSKGLYNRVDEFKDATKCALARFQSPEFFSKE
jgi:inosine/xanthosine triphosphatase